MGYLLITESEGSLWENLSTRNCTYLWQTKLIIPGNINDRHLGFEGLSDHWLNQHWRVILRVSGRLAPKSISPQSVSPQSKVD